MPLVLRKSVVAFCAVLLLAGLGGRDLFRNEGLRARLAAEALEGGSWLVPTLYGEPHLTKPPGMSLAIALCSLPAGRVTPVTARLPSVLAGACAVALVGWAVARACGAGAGWLAAAVLPCAPLWLDRAPSAEIDLVQLAWVAGSLVCLLRAAESGETSAAGGWPWWLLALFCVAGGLFTKWTAPAFFYLAAVPFLYWRGRLRLLLSAPHLAGALAVAALAVGWLVIAGRAAGWGPLVETLSREALMRLSPGHHPRPYPWGELATFPLGFLAGCLPWSLCALPALRPGFGRLLDERQRRLWQLALCWLVPSLAFWTLAPGHRPRHLLPAQPAVAILAVLAWLAWLEGRLRWPVPRLPPRRALAGLLLAGLAVKLVFVAAVAPAREAGRSPRAGGRALARLVPAGETLVLFRLKDEGLLFYYGRPARRLRGPAELAGRPAWCLLTEPEWRVWPAGAGALVRARLRDGQGAPIVLVRLPGDEHARPPRRAGGGDPGHRGGRRPGPAARGALARPGPGAVRGAAAGPPLPLRPGDDQRRHRAHLPGRPGAAARAGRPRPVRQVAGLGAARLVHRAARGGRQGHRAGVPEAVAGLPAVAQRRVVGGQRPGDAVGAPGRLPR
jgi:4-amino-4-deoxy-L-arabinose transferase-like glycosyltransferase